MAGSGLIAFALTVALVQQSVRGAIEANVKTGGTLFEIDHVSTNQAKLSRKCNVRMPHLPTWTEGVTQGCIAISA